mgnify:CR=1 FL=1
MEIREGYWDYMGRRLREDVFDQQGNLTVDEMWKREIAEMQKTMNYLQTRVKDLHARVHELNTKITILGGDPRQMELDI